MASQATLEPNLGSWICTEHGSYRLLWCTKCNARICRDCTVVEHPINSCPIISVKEAFEAIKEEEEKLVGESNTVRDNHIMVLKDYLSRLCRYKEKHKKQMSAFKELVDTQDTTVGLLEMEGERVRACLQKGEDIVEKMTLTNDQLAAAGTTEEITSTMRGFKIRRKEMKIWIQNSNEELAKCDQLEKSEKLQNILDKTLRVPNVEKADADCQELTPMNDFIAHEVIQRGLTASSLTDLLKPVTTWAVLADKSLASPITLDGQNLRLHSLRDTAPPKDAIIVPYDEVKKLIGKSPVAFMELSIEEQSLGSVHIQTGNYNEESESFLRRFTGEDTSFINSKMIENRSIDSKGWKGLCGGGDGTPGQVLETTEKYITRNSDSWLSSSDSMREWVTLAELNDTLCFVIWHDEMQISPAQVGSQPRNRKKLGKVSEGLDVIQKAATQSDLSKVEIVDCGIFIK